MPTILMEFHTTHNGQNDPCSDIWLDIHKNLVGCQGRWKLVNFFDADPAGIIDSAEAQMKLNLNEWVRTDMNVCWSYPEPIRNINNQQRDYIELG